MVSTSFMQEGLAVAVDDIIFNRKLKEEEEFKFIDDWCREQLDKMPQSLPEAMESFDTLPNQIIIPFTASFSKFILNNYGIKRYKQAYIGQKEIQNTEENIKVIEKTYNLTHKEFFDKWKDSLSK